MSLVTLMTAEEVVANSPLKDDFPSKVLCSLIYPIEYNFFSTRCLSIDFYDLLISKQTDFSGYTEYTDDEYELGNSVMYNGKYYVSLTDANVSLPTDTNDWEEVKKFNLAEDAHYQLLWENHLKYILALDIARSGVRYATNPAGTHGVTELKETDRTHVVSASKGVLTDFKMEMQVDRDRRIKVMLNWMERTKETYDWEETPYSSSEDADTCNNTCTDRLQGKNRIAWRY